MRQETTSSNTPGSDKVFGHRLSSLRAGGAETRRWFGALSCFALTFSVFCAVGISAAWAKATSTTSAGPSALLQNLHPDFGEPGSVALADYEIAGTRVNLLNGASQFETEIGNVYPVSPELSYQFKLQYSSQIWDVFVGPQGARQVLRKTNSGAGFHLSFGDLYAPSTEGNPTETWLFRDESGRRSALYQQLHEGIEDGNTSLLYSRDGTYLRLVVDGAEKARVEFPTGLVKEFARAGDAWRISSMYSRAAETQRVIFQYEIVLNELHVRLVDPAGRVHLIVYADSSGQQVRSLRLAAPNDRVANYSFEYETQSVEHSCGLSGPHADSVALLRRISGPEGFAKAFEYGVTATDCAALFRIRQRTLATGGTETFRYATYGFPRNDCAVAALINVAQHGLVELSRDPGNQDVAIARWTITPTISYSSGDAACQTGRRLTHISEPGGLRISQSFSLSLSLPSTYGLPINTSEADTRDSQVAYLAREEADCSGAVCVATRKRYVQFLQSYQCTVLEDRCFHSNRQVSESRTYYVDDNVAGVTRYSLVRFANADGYGNFSRETWRDNFSGSDRTTSKVSVFATIGSSYPIGFRYLSYSQVWNLRKWSSQTRTDYRGTAWRIDQCIDSLGRIGRTRHRANAAATGAGDLVIANEWPSTQARIKSWYGADAVTLGSGELCALALPAPSYRVAESYSSGALARRQSIDVSNESLAVLLEDNEIDRNSGLAIARYVIGEPRRRFKYDLRGRVTETTTPGAGAAKVATTYLAIGAPQNRYGGETVIATSTDPSSGAALRVAMTFRDGLGQEREHRVTIDDEVNRDLRRVDALGRTLATVTTTGVAEPGAGTWANTAYDGYGRWIRKWGGGHAIEDRQRHLIGVRLETETRNRRSGGPPMSAVCWTTPIAIGTERDVNGRVVRTFDEAHGGDRAYSIERLLEYDGSGQPLVERTLHRKLGALYESRVERQYSNLGFLKATRHLSGGALQRAEFRSSIDAWDLARRIERHDFSRADSAAVAIFTYDSAGRVRDVVDGELSNRELLQIRYAPDTLVDLSAGRPTAAGRFTYWLGRKLGVTSSYTYDGQSESPSVVRTAFTHDSAGWLRGLPRSYEARTKTDAIGRVESVTYPTCIACADGEPFARRELQFDRHGQALGRVDEAFDGNASTWLSGIGYDDRGNVASLTFGNGVIEEIQDSLVSGAVGVARMRIKPGSSQCFGILCPNYDSGLIAYDGEGATCGTTSAPALLAETLPTPAPPPNTDSCAWTMTVDGLGLLTGENTRSECRTHEYPIYDAAGRIVGVMSQSASKIVDVAGTGPVLVADPEQWYLELTLLDTGGDALRRVRTGLETGDWRETEDRIYALGREVGREKLTRSGGAWLRAREYHHGIHATGATGNVLRRDQ